jgi:endogenous inhibitor of DNA gyrase (YacG/DUF329 family)
MPLSVVEGHKDGAVTDFDWLDTPQPVQLVHATATEEAPETVGCSGCQAPVDKAPRTKWMPFYTITVNRTAAVLIDLVGIWQHTISVGRDGRCSMQSFARGAFAF